MTPPPDHDPEFEPTLPRQPRDVAPPVPASRIEETRLVGKNHPRIRGITLTGKLGQGGMGIVYRGRQDYMERAVAVKLLTDGASTKVFQARFRREAKILAGITHPNIVTCYQAGVTEEQNCYMVMELVDGPNLRQWIASHGTVPPREVVRLGRDLARALRHAKGAGIIHRDVKPDNVLLSPKENPRPDDPFPYEVKVVDLGLARPEDRESTEADMNLTMPGEGQMGTPSTMAPEQYDSPEDVDFRCDIYGLGCVLFHAATGRQAFPQKTASSLFASKAAARGPDPRELVPSLPLALGALIQDMLAHKPEDRPASYEALIERLQACEAALDGNGGVKRGYLVGAAGIVAVLGLAAAGMTMLGNGDAPPLDPLPDPAPSVEIAAAADVDEKEDVSARVDLSGWPAGTLVEWRLVAVYGEDPPRGEERRQLDTAVDDGDGELLFALPNQQGPWRLELQATVRPPEGSGLEPAQSPRKVIKVSATNDAPRPVAGADAAWQELRRDLESHEGFPVGQSLEIEVPEWQDDDSPLRYQIALENGTFVSPRDNETSFTVPGRTDRGPRELIVQVLVDDEVHHTYPPVSVLFVPRLTWSRRTPERIEIEEGEAITLSAEIDGAAPDGGPAVTWRPAPSNAFEVDLDESGRLRVPDRSEDFSVHVRAEAEGLEPRPVEVFVKAKDDPPGGAERQQQTIEALLGESRPLALDADRHWSEPDEDQRPLQPLWSVEGAPREWLVAEEDSLTATWTPLDPRWATVRLTLRGKGEGAQSALAGEWRILNTDQAYPIELGESRDLRSGWANLGADRGSHPVEGDDWRGIWDGPVQFDAEVGKKDVPYAVRDNKALRLDVYEETRGSITAVLPHGDWSLLGLARVASVGKGDVRGWIAAHDLDPDRGAVAVQLEKSGATIAELPALPPGVPFEWDLGTGTEQLELQKEPLDHVAFQIVKSGRRLSLQAARVSKDAHDDLQNRWRARLEDEDALRIERTLEDPASCTPSRISFVGGHMSQLVLSRLVLTRR